jgi:hypothetical protein
MTTRHLIVLAASCTVCLAIVGCKGQSSAFPLSLQTVRDLNPTDTAQITFQEQGGEIFVTVVDKSGDGHIHKLSRGTNSPQQALEILRQKQRELEAPR